MTPLDNLISRLEAATSGSRELDEEIAGIRADAILERQPGGRASWHRDGFWVSVGEVLPYTASIDAAMALLPKECSWKLVYEPGRALVQYCVVIREADRLEIVAPAVVASKQTAAIALCVAAINRLRARSTLPETEG